jgi:hypothetical protein
MWILFRSPVDSIREHVFMVSRNKQDWCELSECSIHSVALFFDELTSEQLESRPFPTKDAGGHWSTVDADADTQRARIRAELVLQLLHDVVERDHAVSRETAHGERVVLARLRHAAGRHIAISDGFYLLKNEMPQYIKHT